MNETEVLVLLSGENYSMARAEIGAICDIVGAVPGTSSEEDTVAVLSPVSHRNLFISRPGLSHSVMERRACFSIDDSSFIKETASILNEVVRGKTFWVKPRKLHGFQGEMDVVGFCRELGGMLDGKKATTNNPDIVVELWFGKRIHAGLSMGEVDRKSQVQRKVDKRPFFSPVSLHPMLARCMINLARIKEGETIYDPFCGTGGILLEAGCMGMKTLGSDVRRDMVDGTIGNLEHFGMRGRIFKHDIRDCVPGVNADGIVTDTPYGRSTSVAGKSVEVLSLACLHRAEEILDKGRRLVMGTSSASPIQDSEEMRLEEVHSMYVHKSLTRNFSVYKKV